MQSMNYIGKVLSNFKEFYNEINAATLTGAIDVIVVEQPDGTFNSSPFHVRFGKLSVLRSREKVVDITVNGEPLDIRMKLGESGEAFFVEDVQDSDSDDIPDHLATSPIPVEFEELYNSQGRRRNSFDLGTNLLKPQVYENEVNDYTKRRHTASNADESTAKDFFKRQIGLGNIEVTENSAEDLSLSLPSNNATNISNDNLSSISEQIFQKDTVDNESAKLETKISETPNLTSKSGDYYSSDSKSVKKRKRKKSMMKKKNAQRKSSIVESSSIEITESTTDVNKTSGSGSDRSSLASNFSESELRDTLNKTDMDITSSNNRKILDPEFHFFSDTELTTGPGDARPISPTNVEAVLSDTEFECQSRKGDVGLEGQSWAWGELPNSNMQSLTSSTYDKSGGASPSQQHNFMVEALLSIMRHRRQNSNSNGRSLQELTSGEIDPKIAALYIQNPESKKDLDAEMDCESGNGPSLAQSPVSAEGCKSIDSDFEEHTKATQSYLHDITISLCGWDPEPTEEKFSKHALAFSDLCNNPSILESPKLVVHIADKYYNFKVAAPIITSLMIFQRPLPQSTIDQLCNLHMMSQDSQDKQSKGDTRYSWWSWRRNRGVPPETRTNADGIKSGEVECKEPRSATAPAEIPSRKIDHSATEDGYFGSQSSGSDHGKDISMIEEKPLEQITETLKSEKSDKCRKTLRLSSDQIKRLNLRDGSNEVEFSVTTAYQGTTTTKCHIYKWKWDDKIVISDIDGTITKSDVLGHILPIVGKDWAQSGVAQLFSKIGDNGYKLLYLSARAIGQASITREYIKSIKQGHVKMPDGPVLLNPTSLITAFHREVIEKKPEKFKISCMSDIRTLFPPDANPFYAGYGNRINDVWAYRAVGIPIVRIFTINHKGELKHELTRTFQSSYVNMSNYVDQLFPPLIEAANDYSQFSYWREPIPVLEELETVEQELTK